jgi:hypothetical protein
MCHGRAVYLAPVGALDLVGVARECQRLPHHAAVHIMLLGRLPDRRLLDPASRRIAANNSILDLDSTPGPFQDHKH